MAGKPSAHITIHGIPQVKAAFELRELAVSPAAVRPILSGAGMIIESAAKARAPVLTGTLRRSIHHEVSGYEVSVGTDLEYAPYQEYGTRYMSPRPFLRPAIDETRGEVLAFVSAGLKGIAA